MMMIAEMTDKCRDCCHMAAEHDTVVGCRHALTVNGEQFDCVCSHYAD